MKIRIAYILSHIQKALAFEWIVEELNTKKFELVFILLNPDESPLEDFLKKAEIPTYRITYRGKKNFFATFFKLSQILKKEKIEIIHSHIFDAALLGMLTGRWQGIHKRIYTRHHSSLHHVYYPRAVYYDRFINYWASDIVAISQNVVQILQEKEQVKADKIHLIHHGFRLEAFEDIEPIRIENLRLKYKSKGRSPVIGVIARQTEWKGIQFVIEAFQKVLMDYPQAYLLLANSKGDYAEQIQVQLSQLPETSYCQIPFESDIFALYQLLDIYIHTPIDDHSEAFGQTYVEALAAGIPSIFTLSGVASEFIQDEKEALIVPYQNAQKIYEAVLRLQNDQALQKHLIRKGREKVQQLFPLSKMIQKLEALYSQK